ncbi:MAG TPA: malate synthase A, partial [Chloroflexota bacterium]
MAMVDGVDVRGPVEGRAEEILSPTALAFVAALQREFGPRRLALLEARQARQAQIDAGELPGFVEETRSVREGDWRVAPAPADLQDRRVEITGPVDRKMMINALNSGARVFLADFEDALAPTWDNLLQGQLNLIDAVEGTITLESPERTYRLNERIATLILRPRGWHLSEKHLWIDGVPMSASLFDFGLSFFHTAQRRLDHASGPYYYLPKLEGRLEARLWNDVFLFAQE